jgi:hypothetical protein
MTQPVLLAVDDDGEVANGLEQALRERYEAHYQIVAERFPAAAFQVLEQLHDQGVPIALIIADQWIEPAARGEDDRPPGVLSYVTRSPSSVYRTHHPAAPGALPGTAGPSSRDRPSSATISRPWSTDATAPRAPRVPRSCTT